MQTPIRRAIAAAVLAVVPAGLAACGDDDDAPATTELSIPTGAATSAATSTTGSADTTSSTRAPRDVQPTSTKPLQTTMVTEASGATLGVASTTTALGRS